MADLSDVKNALVTGKALLEDPALPEVTRLVLRLRAISGGGAQPIKPGQTAAAGRGIGLRYVVTPLKLVVAARENPMVGVAILGTILAVPFFAGYLVGRSSR